MVTKLIGKMKQGSNLQSSLQVDGSVADKRYKVVRRSGLDTALIPVVGDCPLESVGGVVLLLMWDREVVMHIVELEAVGKGIVGWPWVVVGHL
jgi:hypothetical protein